MPCAFSPAGVIAGPREAGRSDGSPSIARSHRRIASVDAPGSARPVPIMSRLTAMIDSLASSRGCIRTHALTKATGTTVIHVHGSPP